jgi:hypothetical protein
MTHKKYVKELKFKLYISGTAVITNTMGCHTHSHPTPNASHTSPPPKKKKCYPYVSDILYVILH